MEQFTPAKGTPERVVEQYGEKIDYDFLCCFRHAPNAGGLPPGR